MKKMKIFVMSLQIFGNLIQGFFNSLSFIFIFVSISHYNLSLQAFIITQHPKTISCVLVRTKVQNFCINNRICLNIFSPTSLFLYTNHFYNKKFCLNDNNNKYYKKSRHSRVGFKNKDKCQNVQLNKFSIFTPHDKYKLSSGILNYDVKDFLSPTPDLTKIDNTFIKDVNAPNVISEELPLLQNVLNNDYQSPLFNNDCNMLNDFNPKEIPNRDKLYIDKSIIYNISSDQYIVVGFIAAAHGLNGYIKVKSYTKNPELKLCKPGYRFLKFPYNDDNVIPMKITNGKCLGDKDSYLVKLEGIDTKAQALRLKGAYITILLNDIDPLEENTFYASDLLDLDLYLYNDINRTKLGKIVGFLHRSDIAYSKKYEDFVDDLIDVEMDMRISLKTLINATKENSEKRENSFDTEKGVSIITENDLDDADDIIDVSDEFDKPIVHGVHYIKYYNCSICKKSFTNYDKAMEHDKMHKENVITTDILVNNEDDTNQDNKLKIVDIEEISKGKIRRPIRRFYVPLVKDETVKFIDVENRSVYVDPYTIFIGEDGTSVMNSEN